MVNIEGLWPRPSRPWPISYAQFLPIIAMFLSIAQKNPHLLYAQCNILL